MNLWYHRNLSQYYEPLFFTMVTKICNQNLDIHIRSSHVMLLTHDDDDEEEEV